MSTFVFTLILIGLFFVGMSVRLLLLKNGEFKGTCASQSPFLNKEGVRCGYCGKDLKAGEACGNPDNEVDKVLSKFK
ncbi:MAG: hypothetical protein HEP71_23630 [Roseivirga sp.]|nr:hypothetical protein [Roseivirga sp.]